jgi:hypothetical protein
MFDEKPYLIIDDWVGLETSDFQYVRNSLEHIPFLLKTSGGYDDSEGMPYFVHRVQDRAEKTDKIPVPESLMYTPIAKTIVRLMDSINVEYLEIGRISINTTFNATNVPNTFGSIPHVDHSYSHLQMIIYLNDSDGDTLLFDKVCDFQSPAKQTVVELGEENIMHRISPKKNRILLFDGSVYHTNYLPSKNYRSIIVASIVK